MIFFFFFCAPQMLKQSGLPPPPPPPLPQQTLPAHRYMCAQVNMDASLALDATLNGSLLDDGTNHGQDGGQAAAACEAQRRAKRSGGT